MEHIDSPERLNETQLPPKKAFYSQLNGTDISDEEYEQRRRYGKYLTVDECRFDSVRVESICVVGLETFMKVSRSSRRIFRLPFGGLIEGGHIRPTKFYLGSLAP
jgi:hypothetical protein